MLLPNEGDDELNLEGEGRSSYRLPWTVYELVMTARSRAGDISLLVLTMQILFVLLRSFSPFDKVPQKQQTIVLMQISIAAHLH